MPTQIDTPSALGSFSDWKLWGTPIPANAVAAVAANDGDTSVITASTGGAQKLEQFRFPVLLGVADPVTACSIRARTREYLAGGGGRIYFLRYNGANVGVNRQQEVHIARPSYINVTYNASGGELALAAVNGQHGLYFNAAGGPSQKAEYWVTHFVRTVTYAASVAAGGGGNDFAFQVVSIAAAVIGPGLLLREMPALARYIFGKRGILILPHEYEDFHRAWVSA